MAKNQKGATKNVNAIFLGDNNFPTYICSICGKEFRGYSNNAYPYEGECCDDCHCYIVLPKRYKILTGEDVIFVK